jgi:hypothetical protein
MVTDEKILLSLSLNDEHVRVINIHPTYVKIVNY